MSKLKHSFSVRVQKEEELHLFFKELMNEGHVNGYSNSCLQLEQQQLNLDNLNTLLGLVDTKKVLTVLRTFFNNQEESKEKGMSYYGALPALADIILDVIKPEENIPLNDTTWFIAACINRVVHRNGTREEWIRNTQKKVNEALFNLDAEKALQLVGEFKKEEPDFPTISHGNSIKSIEGFVNVLRRQTEILISKDIYKIYMPNRPRGLKLSNDI